MNPHLQSQTEGFEQDGPPSLLVQLHRWCVNGLNKLHDVEHIVICTVLIFWVDIRVFSAHVCWS